MIPDVGETGVSPDSHIAVLFSEALDESSITSSTVRIIMDNTTISGTINVSDTLVSFIPDSALPVEKLYTVNLSQDIRGLAENNMSESYSWSFTSRDRGWEDPVYLELSAEDADYGVVEFDGSGNAIALWTQTSSSLKHVFASRYEAGSGWGSVQRIDSEANEAYSPCIAINDSGEALAVWAQDDGSYRSIYAGFYDPDTGWTSDTLIESGNSGNAMTPQAVIDNEGNCIIVWYQYDGSRWNVYARRYDVTNGWLTVTEIDANTNAASDCTIAVDGAGNAISAWMQSDGNQDSIYTNRYNATTEGWEGPVLLETEDSGGADSPVVAMNASGDGMIVWIQNDGSANNICARRYDASSGWETMETIENNDGTVLRPVVALNDDGSSVAVWEQRDASSAWNILANRFEEGYGWEGATTVDNCTDGDSNTASIAMDDDGNALVVWADAVGSTIFTSWNRYLIDAGWQTAGFLSSDYSYSPAVTVTDEGDGIALYLYYDDTTENVLAAHFR